MIAMSAAIENRSKKRSTNCTADGETNHDGGIQRRESLSAQSTSGQKRRREGCRRYAYTGKDTCYAGNRINTASCSDQYKHKT